jgi:hypothetical protein
VVVDASGSWTKQVDDAALARLEQMGATLINTQAIAGEMQNALAVRTRRLRKQPARSSRLVLEVPAGPALMVLGAAAPSGFEDLVMTTDLFSTGRSGECSPLTG